MKLLSLNNNNHVKSLRYSWNYIIQTLIENTNDEITIVDFMDKYFNALFDEEKNITVHGIKYCFKVSDTYVEINGNDKSDIFIHYDEYGLYHMIKWYPEFNEFKFLRGKLLSDVCKKYNTAPIETPWIGIIHYPEFTKDMNYESTEDLKNIVKTETFKKSIIHCKCIITLSEHCKKYIQRFIKNIPIEVLYHPTDFNCPKFTMNKYELNDNKKIVQVGFWMRKVDTIYNIDSPYTKYWLPGGSFWKEYTRSIYPNYGEMISDNKVDIKLNLPNIEYDALFDKNIILVNVFNSSANNTVLECISRNTPLIVKRNPAIVEYLGIDYPLYFDTIDDINNMLKLPKIEFNNLIKKTTSYLKTLDKSRFLISTFITDIHKILKNIN